MLFLEAKSTKLKVEGNVFSRVLTLIKIVVYFILAKIVLSMILHSPIK